MKVVRVDQEVEQIFSNFVIFCVSFIDFGFSNFKYLTKILANHQHKTATITSQFFDVLLDILFGILQTTEISKPTVYKRYPRKYLK